MTISPGNKYPRAFIDVKFGAGKSSPLTAPRTVLIMGYQALVGPSQGSALPNVVYPIPSVDDAIALFGGGSEIHQGADAALDQVLDTTLYGVAFAEVANPAMASATSFSQWTLTPTGASVIGGVFYLIVDGVEFPVSILDGMSVADQLTAIYAEIGKYKNLPVWMPAAPSSTTLGFRTKHTGLRSNQHVIRFRVEGITGTSYAITQTVTAVNDGNPQTCFDAINQQDFDYIVCAATEPAPGASPNPGITRFINNVNSRAQPLVGLRGVLVCAMKDSYANVVTNALGVNAHRCFLLWCRDAEDFSMRIAARYAAAIALGTSSDPTANLCNTAMVNLIGPQLKSSWISEQEATQALNNGITPLRFNRQGSCYVTRPITSRFQDLNGNPDYRTLDIGKVLEPDYIADYLASDIPVTWAGYKLRDDDPNDLGQPLDKVCTPKLFKSYLAGILRTEYSLNRLKNPEPYINGDGSGSIQGVLRCYIHPVVGWRIVADMPADVIDIFAQQEITVRQVG